MCTKNLGECTKNFGNPSRARFRSSITRNLVTLLTFCLKITSRNYVFTYNDPPREWDPELLFDGGQFRFLAGQFERGEGTGRLHFQGYAVFTKPVRLAGAKRLLDAHSAHFEIRRGDHDQALAYCTKDATREPGRVPCILGEPPLGAGTRTDVDDIRGILRDGGTLLDCADRNFGLFLRSYRAMGRYISLLGQPRNSPPECFYFWGPSGSGKTRAVWETYDNDSTRLYSAPLCPTGGSAWFDGYVNHTHEAILLDDYYHNYRLTFFLQLLDRYALQLPIKGGFSHIGNVPIYITSNIPLEEQYPNAPDQNSIRRRFHEVRHYVTHE